MHLCTTYIHACMHAACFKALAYHCGPFWYGHHLPQGLSNYEPELVDDETLPIINKPKHPQKKEEEGGNTRNKMEGPTSKKIKETT